jgi:hypothetical protein
MLNDLEAPHVCALAKLMETQSKATLVRWATDYCECNLLPLYQKHCPNDPRLECAIEAARKWLAGLIKLPEAKKYILACHAAAREAYDNKAAQGAARAVGQSASTIHSTKHCMGLALYGAPAIAYDTLGNDAAWEDIDRYSEKVCRHMEASLRAYAETLKPEPIG